VLLLASEWLFLILFRRQQRRMVVAWTAAHAMIALGMAGWIYTINVANVRGVTSWIVTPGLREIGMAFLVFAGGRASNENPASHLPTGISLDLVLAAVVLVVVGWFVSSAVRKTVTQHDVSDSILRPGETLGLLMLWLLLPGTILCLASFIWRPCFVYRYILYSALPLHILLGGAVAAIRSSRAKAATLALLLALYGYQLSALTVGPFRPDWRSVSRYLESRVTPEDRILVFQDINLVALQFNSTLPQSQMRHIPVWSEICAPVVEAHQQGRDVWLVLWLWSDPSNIESCFPANCLAYTKTDFKGWPNLRVYHVPK
jgi:hypothetical protein